MIGINVIGVYKSGIKIKKSRRGLFTEYCGGKVTDECISRAKKSKNPKLRKRATFAANSRRWAKKHQEGGPMGIDTILSKLRDYARHWYSERAKLDKYKDLLEGNMDKINELLSINGYTPYKETITKLGNKKPVGDSGLPIDAGFVTGDKTIDGKPLWFGKRPRDWWHEGIGHWLGDLIPGLLSKYPKTYMKYLNSEYDPYGIYQKYINKQNENHAQTWEFRGLNKNMKDNNGKLYIDPNRLLTPEDVQEMIDKGAKLPQGWQNTNITPTGIADFHNTFADNTKRKDGALFAKQGIKLINNGL